MDVWEELKFWSEVITNLFTGLFFIAIMSLPALIVYYILASILLLYRI